MPAPVRIKFLSAEPAYDPETGEETVLIWFDIEDNTQTCSLSMDDALDLAQQVSDALAQLEGGAPTPEEEAEACTYDPDYEDFEEDE